MKRIFILAFLVFTVFQSYSQATWSGGTNKLFTNSATKVGIRNTDPAQELDVTGNVNVTRSQLIGKQLSFGTTGDNIGIFYAPATSGYPPTLYFRGTNGEGGPRDAFPSGEPTSGDPIPNLSCVGADFQYSFGGAVTIKGPGSHTGNLMLNHDGTDGIIETQGTGLGSSTHPGDLFINRSCNRNVFMFSNGTTFNPGFNKVFSIAGFLNVTQNVQIGGGVSSTNFSQLGAQVYVDAGVNSTGIKVKHAYNATGGAGIMTTESFDSDLGLAVYKAGTTDAERFTVQGDGKTTVSASNSDAFIIKNASATPIVSCKIANNGQTFLGQNVQTNTGAMLTVGQNSKTSLALSLTDNTNSTNKDFFNVYGNGYTEIKVYSPSAMPIPNYSGVTGPRVLTIRDFLNNKDLFVVRADGKVYAREIEINLATNFPDYVFSKNYSLKSIVDLAKFIDKNHHLPGFEKGEFYEKNGINVNDMIILQQEKIEELTLYIIQQEKRLLALEQKK